MVKDGGVDGIGMDRNESWLQTAGSLCIGELPCHDASALTLGIVVDERGAGSHLVGTFGQSRRLRGEHRGIDQVGVV